MATKDPARVLITAALPYANGPIHIGHLAGAYLPADLYARYQRLQGRDVAFICGSDEMGVAIMMRSFKEDTTPQEIVDRYHPMIKESFDQFGMSFDYYGRTTSEVHRETSQDFFRTLAKKNAFKLSTDEQLYDPEAEMFLADRFVRGTCPVCGYEEAYGDQCEKCGSSLSPTELIEPRSALTDATPVLRETTHWYLPLGDLQPELEAWIDTREGWKPNVKGQVKSWFTEGLRDRAITRDVAWGVPVPEDVADEAGVDGKGKVIYVWFDAPIGYISATKEWAAQTGAPERWKEYWQQEDTQLVHFIGKDNIVFHCLMFPAMLMEHGKYVLPENVPANEFLNLEGEKLSTSRGWAVWLHEYLEEFPADLLRYALAATLPETKDADFSWTDFQTRVNSELADVLGNFVNRTMTFAHRFFDGQVPPLKQVNEEEQAVLNALEEAPARIAQAYEAYRMREAVFETMQVARLGNKFFNDTEPWHTRKTEPQRAANTIHICLQLCAALGVLLDPVVPDSARKLRSMLHLTDVRSGEPETAPSERGWMEAGSALLQEGHEVGEAVILFSKLEDDRIKKQIDKLNKRAEEAMESAVDEKQKAYEQAKEQIEYDDFVKMDLRVGTVTLAEPVPKADKLLRLEVDLGYEERQVVAGIAEHMEPEEIQGKKVVVVANLKPRKLFGLESQGMVLMSEDRDGALRVITTAGENGAVVR